MKKEIKIYLLLNLITILSFGQINNQKSNLITNIPPDSCFCCNDFFHLITPTITGQTSININCKTNLQYCIKACAGAIINWNTNPVIPFVGQGTNCITLTSNVTTNFTIGVTIACHNSQHLAQNHASSTLGVTVNNIICNDIRFNINFQNLPPQPGAAIPSTRLILSPISNLLGVKHYWEIETFTCPPFPNPNFWEFQSSEITYPSASAATSTVLFDMFYDATGLAHSSIGFPQTAPGYALPGGVNYDVALPNGDPRCLKIKHYVFCCGNWILLQQGACLDESDFMNGQGQTQALPPSVPTPPQIINPTNLPQALKNFLIQFP